MKSASAEEIEKVKWNEIFAGKTQKIQTENLSRLFLEYHHQRRFDTLISSMLTFFQDAYDEKIKISPEIVDEFTSCCQALHGFEALDLWEKFVQFIQFETQLAIPVGLDVGIQLFCSLIMNTKLEDYNVDRAENVLDSMSRECLPHLLKCCCRPKKKSAVSLARSLGLCYAWGETMIILDHYFEKTLSKSSETVDAEHPWNLQFIHFYFDKWENIYSQVKTSSNESSYIYALLQLQKIRVLHKTDKFTYGEHLKQCAKILFELAVISLQQKSKNQNNVFLLFLNNLPLLLPLLKEDEILSLNQQIVRIFCENEQPVMQEQIKTILTSERIKELYVFQTSFITTIWKEIYSLSDGRLSIFAKLSDELSTWLETRNSTPKTNPNDQSWKKIAEIGDGFNEILEENTIYEMNVEQVERLLQTLNLIPLNFLLPINQTRCLFGIFALMSNFVDDVTASSLITHCRKMINIFFHGFRSVWFLHFVSNSAIFKWSLRFQQRRSSKIMQADSSALQLQSATFEEYMSDLLLRMLDNHRKTINEDLEILVKSCLISEKKWHKFCTAEKEVYYIVISLLFKDFKAILNSRINESLASRIKKCMIQLSDWFLMTLSKEGSVITKCSSLKYLILTNFCLVMESLNLMEANDEMRNMGKNLTSLIGPLAMDLLMENTEDEKKLFYCSKFFTISSKFVKSSFHIDGLVLWKRISSVCYRHRDDKDEKKLSTLRALVKDLLSSIDIECFKHIVNEMLDTLTLGNEKVHTLSVSDIDCCLHAWISIPFVSYENSEKINIIAKAIEEVIVLFPSLIQRTEKDHISIILIPAMKLLKKILRQSKLQINFEYVNFCLHIFVDVLNSLPQNMDDDQFFLHFDGLYSILNEYFLHHVKSNCKWLPAINVCITGLVEFFLTYSDQSTTNSQDQPIDVKLNYLKECAYNLNRLFDQIAKLEEDYARLAPFFIATFMAKMQEIVMFPAIKEITNQSIFKMLDICDKNSILFLQTNLSQASREIFKQIYDVYQRYHKYKGKV